MEANSTAEIVEEAGRTKMGEERGGKTKAAAAEIPGGATVEEEAGGDAMAERGEIQGVEEEAGGDAMAEDTCGTTVAQGEEGAGGAAPAAGCDAE